MKQTIAISMKLLLLMTVLTGILYPVVITGIGSALFPHEAGGSLLKQGEQVIGSEHIAQRFGSERYVWPRPSASAYRLLPSSASNAGPTSRALHDSIAQRRQRFLRINALSEAVDVPAEMLCASASGVDPDISPAAAYAQADRIARARGMNAPAKALLYEVITEHIQDRQFGMLGEPRVNVLRLNIALDSLGH